MRHNNFSHTLLALAAVLMLVTSLHGQEELKVALSNPGKRGALHVETHRGPITVKGVNRQDVLVRYKSMDGNETKVTEAKNGMKKISGGAPDLEIVEQDNSVYIESDSWNKGVELTIEVPTNFDLEVEAYNQGDVNVENINGKLAIESYNGSITAKQVGGTLIASTYNGPIKVTFTQIDANEPMAFDTYNGDVDITFPASLKGTFKMKTQQGDIYTDFDMSVSKGPAPVPKETNKGKRIVLDDWVRGSIGGGGADFTMRTHNGDIFIRKQ